jgi:DNA-binding NarL/FixJ family response regulator
LDPLHVLLVTDDPGLAKGFSDALAEHSALADVEAVRPGAALDPSSAEPDLILLDESSTPGQTPAERPEQRYPDSLVLRVRDETGKGREVQLHSHWREHGYVRREDLGKIAPVVVALAGLSRAAAKRAAR